MDREGAGHLSKAEVASGFGTPVEMVEFAVISCNDSEKARISALSFAPEGA